MCSTVRSTSTIRSRFQLNKMLRKCSSCSLFMYCSPRLAMYGCTLRGPARRLVSPMSLSSPSAGTSGCSSRGGMGSSVGRARMGLRSVAGRCGGVAERRFAAVCERVGELVGCFFGGATFLAGAARTAAWALVVRVLALRCVLDFAAAAFRVATFFAFVFAGARFAGISASGRLKKRGRDYTGAPVSVQWSASRSGETPERCPNPLICLLPAAGRMRMTVLPQQRQKRLAADRTTAKARQVLGNHLAVDENDSAAAAFTHQVHEGNLRGVGFAAEHRFTKEHAPKRHAVEPADQLAVAPGFDTLCVPQGVQLLIGTDHLVRQPRSCIDRAGRGALTNHRIEARIEAHRGASVACPLAQTPRHAQFLGIEHRARIRRPP